MDATVGGGFGNNASGLKATVGGGTNNLASGGAAVVGGGGINTASGDFATVSGGVNNTAAGYTSFAAGNNAHANHTGSLVWSASGGYPTNSPADYTFIANARGGFWFGAVNGEITPAIGAGNLISTSTGARLTTGGAWTNNSDRNTKDSLAPVEGGAVLAAVLDLPLFTYRYRAEDQAVRHLGPMAQDFYAAFNLGDSDTSITTVDAEGVALAAIQGLYIVVKTKDAEISALRDTSTTQQDEIAALTRRVAALESGAAPAQPPATLPWLLLAGLGLLNLGGLAGYALARARQG
jgi:hypothetical protein